MRHLTVTLSLLLLAAVEVFGQQRRSLEYYLDAAKENSPLIKEYRSRQELTDIEIERLKALYSRSRVDFTAQYAFVPIISLDDSRRKFLWNGEQASNYIGYSLDNENTILSGTVNWTKPLLGGAQMKSAVARADIDRSIALNDIRLQQHELEKMVTDQYLLCMLDLESVKYAGATDTLLSGQRDVLQRLAAKGLVRQSELSLLDIEIKANRGQLEESDRSYFSDLMDLNVICGIRSVERVTLEPVELAMSPVSNAQESSYVEKFRLDSMSVIAKQREAEAQYKPSLNAFANAGLNTAYLPDFYKRFGLSAGVAFTVPIYDGGQKRLAAQGSKIAARNIADYRETFLTQREVNRAKYSSQMAGYDRRKALLKEQLESYDKVLADYRKLMATGDVSVVDYLLVVKSRMQTERDYIVLRANAALLVNSFNYWNW